VCDSARYQPLIELRRDDFVLVNPDYDLAQIEAMGFNPDDIFHIVRCEECGFQYSLHQLSAALTTHLYEKAIDHEKSRAKIFSLKKRLALMEVWFNLFALAADNAGESLDLTVLDYGCGWGDFLAVAQAPGIRCVGFEVDPCKIAWAHGMGLRVVDCEDEIDDESPFKVIFCNQVLEHLNDPGSVVEKLSRWLRPGGYGYVAVPNSSEEFIRHVQDLLSRGQPIPKEINPWEHLNYFTPQSLTTMLERYGLKIVQIPYECITLPVSDIGLRQAWREQRILIGRVIRRLTRRWCKPRNCGKTVPSTIAVYVRKRCV